MIETSFNRSENDIIKEDYISHKDIFSLCGLYVIRGHLNTAANWRLWPDRVSLS